MPGFTAVPRLPRGIVRRGRLHEPLDSATPLVVVRGFAGTGKTVLVAEWAHDRIRAGDTLAWHTVERCDRAEFWALVISTVLDAAGLDESGADAAGRGVRVALRRLGADLEAALSAHAGPPRALRQRLVRAFASLDRELILVLDDLHLVADRDIVDDVLALVRTGGALRVVAITRSRATFGGAGPDTVDATVVREQQLLYRAEELEQVLAAAVPSERVPIERVPVELVADASGGIPLLVRRVLTLIAKQLAEHDTVPSARQLEGADRVGLRAFRELLAHDHPGADDDLAAVLRLGVADQLTVPLATELTGRDDAGELLDLAESVGVGSWDEDPQGEPVYTFRPRFLRSLRAELDLGDRAERDRLRRVALRWAETSGRPAEALRLAIDLGDLTIANRVVLAHYEGLLAHDRPAITVALDRLSRRDLASQPLLALLLALCLDADPNQRRRAPEVFAIAQVAVRQAQASVDPSTRVMLRTTESIALRVTGQFDAALVAAERVLDTLDNLTIDERDQLAAHLPTILPQAGLALAAGGRREAARDLYAAAFALPRHHSEIGHLHALALCAGTAAIDGEMVEAARLVGIADGEAWPPNSSRDFTGAFLEVARGTIDLEAGRYDAVIDRVDRMGDYLLNGEHWPQFAHLRAMALLGLRRSLQGATQLELVLEPGARPPVPEHTRQWLTATHATLLVAGGRLTAASEVLAVADPKRAAVRAAMARLHLARGDAGAARTAVQPTDASTPRLRAEQLLLRSAAVLRLGERDAALGGFEQAMVLLEECRMQHPFVLMPESDRLALVGLASASGRMQHARELLASMLAVHSALPEARSGIELTQRERIVLDRLHNRDGTAAIAESLFVSVNTVKTQLRSLYRKLGATSREEALARARRLGLFEG
jgi:LuxR family maltose regulon positive regulatory protein